VLNNVIENRLPGVGLRSLAGLSVLQLLCSFCSSSDALAANITWTVRIDLSSFDCIKAGYETLIIEGHVMILAQHHDKISISCPNLQFKKEATLSSQGDLDIRISGEAAGEIHIDASGTPGRPCERGEDGRNVTLLVGAWGAGTTVRIDARGAVGGPGGTNGGNGGNVTVGTRGVAPLELVPEISNEGGPRGYPGQDKCPGVGVPMNGNRGADSVVRFE
jgi:hypothetical protein